MTTLPSSINHSTTVNRSFGLGRALSLLFVFGLTAGIILAWDEIERLGAYGYPAIFLISLLGNATIVFPAPSFALVAVAGVSLDPVAVGVVAGLGAALGEMTGYLAGYGGQNMLEDRPLYRRLEAWMQKSGSLVIFLLSAVPNPIVDIGGIIAGALRMPAWRFILAAWLGKSLRFGISAGLFSVLAT
jgi:membrane protein YqaA with SNARE-associated domain